MTNIKKSLEFSERAIAMYQKMYQVSTHFCIARALSSITICYQNSRTWREALRVGKKSLAMWNDVFGKESNNRFIGIVLVQLGQTCNHLQQYEQSEAYFCQAVDSFTKLYGPGNDRRCLA